MTEPIALEHEGCGTGHVAAFFHAYANEVKLSAAEVAHWPHALATAWMDFAPWFLSDMLPRAKAARSDLDFANSLLLVDFDAYRVDGLSAV